MLWILAVILIVVGVAGTILPGLPGPVLVFAGLLCAAWADGFAKVGPLALVVLGVLTALTYVIDVAAAGFGAKKLGASGKAALGAAVGMLAGLPFGLPGLIVGPFVGALAVELLIGREVVAATRAGLGAWLGVVAAMIVRTAIVFVMLGLFAAAYLL